jgi:hypothetical protein
MVVGLGFDRKKSSRSISHYLKKLKKALLIHFASKFWNTIVVI